MDYDEGGKFTIRTVSNITGLSPEGIRYYERQGYIRSKRDKQSGYRLYNLKVLRILRTAIKFRNMGFNIKETSNILNIERHEDLVDKLRTQTEKISEEIKYKQMVLKKIEIQLAQMEYFQSNKGSYQTIMRPGLYRTNFYQDQKLITDSSRFSLLHRLMKLQPIVRGYVFTDERQIHIKQKQDFRLSLTIYEEDARQMGLDKEDGLVYLPPAPCIYTTTEELSSDVMQQGVDYVQSHGYQITGEIMLGEISIYRNPHNAGGYDVPYEIWIPINTAAEV